jgi:hypothetical protein
MGPLMDQRLADKVPECLKRDDLPIDEDECQAFFGARREVMLEKNPIPLTPLTREQSDRWQLHLRSTDAGKPIRAKAVIAGVRSALTLLKAVTEPVTKHVTEPVTKPAGVTKPAADSFVTRAKGGRPSKTGKAMTAAERKRLSRANKAER